MPTLSEMAGWAFFLWGRSGMNFPVCIIESHTGVHLHSRRMVPAPRAKGAV
jgi:hypothetical protein